jgi:hypothetical protein
VGDCGDDSVGPGGYGCHTISSIMWSIVISVLPLYQMMGRM